MTDHQESHAAKRIVLTGGPGGGKTTAADLFRREMGDDVVVVPETATILFSGGFPRSDNPDVVRTSQQTIYHVQKNLEEIMALQYGGRALVCDRGTIDGAAYWPDSEEHFFQQVNSSLEKELTRYHCVLYFESAAMGGINIEGGNPIRNESLEQACQLDRKLRKLWEQHPNFHFINHDHSFIKKINTGLKILSHTIAEIA